MIRANTMRYDVLLIKIREVGLRVDEDLMVVDWERLENGGL